MSPFNPDKFRLDSTSSGGVNGTIDRKIEKLSKKCADLIQKNKHKEAKKILDEIKELKSLRLPDEEEAASSEQDSQVTTLERTLVTTPSFSDQEKTVATTPAFLDQEKTVATTPAFSDQEKTVATTPAFSDKEKTVATTAQLDSDKVDTVETSEEKKEPELKHLIRTEENSTVFGESQSDANSTVSGTRGNAIMAGACLIVFFTMAAFSYLAFKDFPGKGNYFDWLRAESIIQRAESERKQGNFTEAIKHYAEAFEIYPESSKSLHAEGSLQLQFGKVDQALSALEKAVQKNDKDPDLLRDYANALRLNEEYQKAFDIVSRLDQKETNTPQNKALLGLIEIAQKHPDAATYIRESMLTKGVNHDRDFYAGIYYRITGDNQKSLESLEKANQAQRDNVHTLVEYIKAKNDLNQIAEKEAAELVGLAPEWAGSWYIKGEQLEKSKKFDEAAQSFEKVAKLDPKNSDRFSRTAQNYLKAGKNAEALRCAYDGLKLRPDEFNCIEIIGEADESISPEKMQELYQKALTAHPKYDQGWRGLAFWQKQAGKVMEALESQSKAVKLDPENASNWYGLAVYLDQCHNNSQALRAAAEAMSLEPENEKYTDLRMKLLSRN